MEVLVGPGVVLGYFSVLLIIDHLDTRANSLVTLQETIKTHSVLHICIIIINLSCSALIKYVNIKNPHYTKFK